MTKTQNKNLIHARNQYSLHRLKIVNDFDVYNTLLECLNSRFVYALRCKNVSSWPLVVMLKQGSFYKGT